MIQDFRKTNATEKKIHRKSKEEFGKKVAERLKDRKEQEESGPQSPTDPDVTGRPSVSQ